jgi:mannitol-1-phosphate/altronate dehydrogenase
MDNCSNNGDKARDAVIAYATYWVEHGLVEKEFLDETLLIH